MEKDLALIRTLLRNQENSESYVEPDQFDKYQVLKGFSHPVRIKDGVPFVNSIISVTSVKKLRPRNDDVFIIGYPKSGTTWVEEIAWLLTHNLNFEQATSSYHFVRVRWIDFGINEKAFEEIPSPRCFKSHLPVKFLPENFNKISKVVYVVRNPKDLVVSTFNFRKSYNGKDEFVGSLDDMVDLFTQGKTPFGPWWEHLSEHESLENVHIVHYEDLLEKSLQTVRALAQYLDKSYTDDELKSLLEFVSFKNMKQTPSMDVKFVPGMFKADFEFFKKGRIGNWKDYLTQEQSEKIEEMIKNKLKYSRSIQFEPSCSN